jgi:hypothetical protein
VPFSFKNPSQDLSICGFVIDDENRASASFSVLHGRATA